MLSFSKNQKTKRMKPIKKETLVLKTIHVITSHQKPYSAASSKVHEFELKVNREIKSMSLSSVQFSHSVVSDSLRPHELQHARPPCPSPTPGVYSNSCPTSRWCHPAISSSVAPFSSHIQSFPPSIRVFSNDSVLHIRWPKYWSFSFSVSPSNENPALISFRME